MSTATKTTKSVSKKSVIIPATQAPASIQSTQAPASIQSTQTPATEKKSKDKKVNEVKKEVEVEAEIAEEKLEDGSDKKKITPTRDSVIQSFEDLVTSIEGEIDSIRESDIKNKRIKFLRSLNKNIKLLRNQCARLIKAKRNSGIKKSTNNNSGFLKPVRISKEMAKFTGWNAEELRSRVDVTKYLCEYIKENKLQNPDDRRQIMVDPKLSKLLKFDTKKETDPLTYYKLQTYIKDHFIKPEAVDK